MTGEPNSHNHNHPSVFNFDPYPPTFPVDWNQANPFARSVPVSPRFGPLGEYATHPNLSEHGNAFSLPGSSLPQTNFLGTSVQGPQSGVLDNSIQQPINITNPIGFAVQQPSIPGSSTQNQTNTFDSPFPHPSWAPVSQASGGFSFGSSKPAQDIVQFPFQIEHGFGQRPFRCKRKTDSPP